MVKGSRTVTITLLPSILLTILAKRSTLSRLHTFIRISGQFSPDF